MTEGPVFLLDHYDNAASGGPMDTTRVLAEIMRQQLDNVAAFGIFDPQAVQQCIAAGIGATLTLPIGGKQKMPMCPEPSEPLQVTGRVKTIFDGKYRAKGPMAAGTQQDMGHAVVLDTGRVEIVLFSRHVEPFDVNTLLSRGHRPDAEALRDAEEPHPLARRHEPPGQGGGRMRRRRRVHLRLWPAPLRAAAPADLSARPAGVTMSIPEVLPLRLGHRDGRRIAQGQVSSVELLKAYLERVDRFNPALNALVVDDRKAAMTRARAADRALAKGEVWGALHGLPMTVKESFDLVGPAHHLRPPAAQETTPPPPTPSRCSGSRPPAR